MHTKLKEPARLIYILQRTILCVRVFSFFPNFWAYEHDTRSDGSPFGVSAIRGLVRS